MKALEVSYTRLILLVSINCLIELKEKAWVKIIPRFLCELHSKKNFRLVTRAHKCLTKNL